MNDTSYDEPNQERQNTNNESNVQENQQKAYNPSETSGLTDSGREDTEHRHSSMNPPSVMMDKPIVSGSDEGISKGPVTEIKDASSKISEKWFTTQEVDDLQTRWNSIQFQFVDSPCASIEQAETMVSEILERVRQTLTTQQNKLNRQWESNDNISTEELRIILQNYASLMNHLLTL